MLCGNVSTTHERTSRGHVTTQRYHTTLLKYEQFTKTQSFAFQWTIAVDFFSNIKEEQLFTQKMKNDAVSAK